MKAAHIFVDIDSQRDFLTDDGAYPVIERKILMRNLRRIFAMARSFHIPVVSSLNTHRQRDWCAGLPIHCLEGSRGQSKVNFTLLRNHTLVDANNTLDLPPGLISNFRQIILRKRTPDFLENPKADRLFTTLTPERFVMFGVGMDLSIKKLALSLIARGKQVAFVPSCCGYWNETDADLARRLIVAKGGLEMTLEELRNMLREAAVRRRVRSIFPHVRQTPKDFRSLAS